MPTVAEQLRAAREARQLTIEQVADLTKIRTDRVRALEAGQFDSFSATVYIRGSVKNYAKLLKLDEATLMASLDADLKGFEKFSGPPPLIETKRTFLDTLISIWIKLNWRFVIPVIAVLAFVLLPALMVLAWRHHQASDPLRRLPPALSMGPIPGETLPLPRK